MRELTIPRADSSESGLTTNEKRAAIAEALALVVTFLVAFTGRSSFSDAIKNVLIAMSVLIGGVGAVAGLLTLRRGFTSRPGRVARIALGGFMTFIGAYTVVHVLS